MSTAFGLSVDELEKLLVKLIQDGEIKARIDSLNKVRISFLVDVHDLMIAYFIP